MRLTGRVRIVAAFSMLLLGVFTNGEPVKGDFVLGTPLKVPNINSSSADVAPCITADGLEMYFASNRDHGADLCYDDIWVARRTAIDDEWGEPVNLGAPINTSYAEANPCISADGLELYFSDVWPSLLRGCDCRPGGHGRGDLWVSKRETREADWGVPANLGPMINSFEYDGTPHISADGLSLYFCSARSPGYGFDLYVSTRPTKEDPWGLAVDLGPPINTMAEEDYLIYPFLSPDGLSLFFAGAPRASTANGSIFVSTRAAVTDPWGFPSLFAVLNSTRHDEGVTFSPADSTLYFVRSDPYNPNATYEPALATFDLWQVEVATIVDFNGDGKVDGKDVLAMTDVWGQSNSQFDIGPTAFGDGVVDIQDMRALAKYIGKDVGGPTLIAHWALDEIEGVTAHDGVGQNDAMVMGNPVWLPDGGKVGGALAFDGIGDLMVVGSGVHLKGKPFSILAWIKGGAPGQVVLSHANGAKLLCANPLDGSLMTTCPDQLETSEAVITDGQWHRIGLVWDGVDRILFVDDNEVARDTRPELVIPDGGLMIGGGHGLDTYWSGLIDEVRIYRRGAEL